MRFKIAGTVFSLIWDYHPAIRFRHFTRYGNGITLRLWRFGLHIFTPTGL